MSTQRYIEAALSRQVVSEEAVARLREHDAQTDTWRWFCPSCKKTITGTLTALKEHANGHRSSEDS